MTVHQTQAVEGHYFRALILTEIGLALARSILALQAHTISQPTVSLQQTFQVRISSDSLHAISLRVAFCSQSFVKDMYKRLIDSLV